MGNNFKRLLSFLLILSLLLPSMVIADRENIAGDISIEYLEKGETDKEREDFLRDLYESNRSEDLDRLNEELEKEELSRLRVLVELDGSSLLELANKEGESLARMDQSYLEGQRRAILSQQDRIKNQISRQGLDVDYLSSYTSILNGFSMELDSDMVETIEKIDGVSKIELVNEYERPRPVDEKDMNTSNGMVGAGNAWSTGYTGEGMLVAVIDTGTDPYHRDFVISEGVALSLDEKQVNNLINIHGLGGAYFTDKVPYAYNYYDKSNIVVEDDGDSQHGMHVAGTVLANGDPAKGGVKGVAPEAQLLSMKVFSNDIQFETTFSDIYLKAIDDAISLGADVINMSLGSPAGFYSESSIEHQALKRAEDAGIINSISAGNSRNIAYGSNQFYEGGLPIYAYNPDIGVVGSPSVSRAALTVAAAENTKLMTTVMKAKPGISGIDAMVINEIGPHPFGNLNNQDGYDYVVAGIGKAEDFAKLEGAAKGKVVLVKRGNVFTDTLENAEKAGAIGCIVYNHEEGGDELINMAGSDTAKIPFAFTTYKYGQALVDNKENRKLVFPKGVHPVDNPYAGRISEFSSWGVAPDLGLKPEITGPGGQIYSTQNNNKYGTMSGTSMSAPHLAGGSALVKDFVNKTEDFPAMSNTDLSVLTRNLLMNTASIMKQADSTIAYSPRLQGAGMMDLDRATKNKVTLLDASDNPSQGRAKVELGELSGDSIDFKLKLKNYGDEDLNYDIRGLVLEQVLDGEVFKEEFALVNEETMGSVGLEAKSEKDLNLSLDISSTREGQFVDGFIILEETSGNGYDLSLPFLGFKGDWGEPRVLDVFNAGKLLGVERPEFIDDRRDEKSQYKFSAFVDRSIFGSMVLNPNEIYYVPEENPILASSILPYISQLRNSKSMEFSIRDKNSNLLRVLGRDAYPRKAHSMNRGAAPVRIATSGEWDGKIDNAYAKDGRYIYQINSELQYGERVQEDKFDIVVDSKPPVLHYEEDGDKKLYYKYDERKNIMTIRASDFIGEGMEVEDVSGLKSVLVRDLKTQKNRILDLDDEILDIVEVDRNKDLYDISIDLNQLLEGDQDVLIALVDRAGLVSEGRFIISSKEEQGHIYLKTPGHLVSYGSEDEKIRESGQLELDFEGHVYGWNRQGQEDLIDEILINGEVVEDIVLDTSFKHVEGDKVIYQGPAYKFSHKLSLPSGYHGISISARSKPDSLGRVRNLAIARYLLVDLELPSLEIDNISISGDRAELDLIGRDNLSYLSISRAGSLLIDTGDVDGEIKDPSELIYKDSLDLKKGLNEIEYEIRDRVYSEKKIVRLVNTDKKLDFNEILALFEEIDGLDLSSYTKESVKKLEDSLEKAKELLDREDLEQLDIDQEVESLKEALEELEKKPVDKTELKDLIRELEALDGTRYTDESYARLLEALEEARLVVEDKGASESDIERAIEALIGAREGLEERTLDRSALKSILEKVDGLDRSKYTDSSLEILEKARQEGQEVYDREDVGQGDIDQAVESIKQALDGLVEKTKPESKPEKPSEPGRPILPPSNGNIGGGENKPLEPKPEPKPEEPESPEKEESILEKRLELEKPLSYIEGYKDNTIRADKTISREEVATIIDRILREDYKAEVELKDMKFKDLKPGRWSEDSIRLLYSMDLIEGYKDGSYRPEDNMTRAEFATIISRLGQLELADKKVELLDIEGHWAEDNINKMVSNSYIDRLEKGKYRPDEDLLRYEMVVIVNKILGRDQVNLDKEAELPDFKDLSEDLWYYEDMIKAVLEI